MSAISHRSQRSSFSVLWLRFVQKYQKSPTSEIWVFEGKDDIHFYSSRIERFYGGAPHRNSVIAEGKSNCLKLRTHIAADDKMRQARVAFFIDQDFDDPKSLAYENTYTTPTYAIENLYYSESCIERLLTEKLHLFDEADASELSNTLSKAIEWRDSVSILLAPYCAVLLLLKDKSEGERKLATFIKDRLIPDVVRIERGNGEISVHAIKQATELCAEHTPPVSITETEISNVVSKWCLEGHALFRTIRGKFLIPHLQATVSVIFEDATKKKDRNLFSKRRRCSFQPREAEILQQLAYFAETPDCLRVFLEGLKQKWSPTQPTY